MSRATDAELVQMLQTIGWKHNPNWQWWARVEIVLGLFATSVGMVSGMQLAHKPEHEVPVWAWLGPILLMTLGGYLALAGHRSHLYQSNNRLAAYLAGCIRRSTEPGAVS